VRLDAFEIRPLAIGPSSHRVRDVNLMEDG
jgi:hypothetical protein